MIKRLIIYLSLIFLMAPLTALAQQRQGDVKRDGLGSNRGENHQKGRRLTRLRLRKMLELLKLDKEQKEPFVKMFSKHHRRMFELMKNRRQLIDDLAETLRDDSGNKAALKSLIKKISKLDEKKIELLQHYLTKVKKMLTIEQQAKLYFFQERFGGELMEKMRDFDRRGGMGKPGGDHRLPPDWF